MKQFWNWATGKDTLDLEDGSYLRLLTAMEVLEAGREAKNMQCEEREEALCANACLLARALERKGKPLFTSGENVLQGLTVSRVQALAKAWAEWDRQVNPGLTIPEAEAAALKKVWSTRRKSACNGVCSGLLGRFLRKCGRAE